MSPHPPRPAPPAQGKRFRSRAEVARYFNLEAAPAKRENKEAEAKAADKAAAAEAKRAAKEAARAAKTAKERAEPKEVLAAPTSRFGRKRSAPSWQSDPYGAGAFAGEDELRGRGRGVAVVDSSLVDHGAGSSATGTSPEVPLEELWKALDASASAASPVDPPASATGGRGCGTGGGRVGGRGVGRGVGRGGGRGGTAGGRGSASLSKLVSDWPLGMRVEVQQESDVHFGAWFEATVYGHKAPDKLRVEYEELCEDDAEADDVADLPGLKRDESAKRVRPLPPQPADGRWLGALSVGDLVQLSYIGGWWDVKVLEVRPQPLFDEPQWIVKSVDFEAVHTVDAAVLRPHAQWDGASKAWRAPAAAGEATSASIVGGLPPPGGLSPPTVMPPDGAMRPGMRPPPGAPRMYGTGPPNTDMGEPPDATPMAPPPPQQQQGFQQHLQQQLLHQQQHQQQQQLSHQQQQAARAEAMQREAAARAAAQQQQQAKRAAEAEAARVLRAEENRKREEEKTVKKEEEKKRKAEEKQAEKDIKKQRKLGGGGGSSASTAVATVIGVADESASSPSSATVISSASTAVATVISVSDVISDAVECQRTDAGGAEGTAV